MAIKLTSLLSQDADNVELARVKLRLWLSELNPNLDFNSGVLHDILLLSGAAQYAGFSTEFERLRLSQSLLGISQTPGLSDADIVNSLLSNYGITRTAGTKSTGSIAIVLSRSTDLVLPSGSEFLANGITYTTSQTIAAKSKSSDVRTTNDRLLLSLTDSTWVFLVPAVAGVEGTAGRLSRGTVAVPVKTIADFRTAYAASDFTDAASTEETADVISRVKFGYALKALAGRSHMQSLLLGVFPGTVAASVLGAGDVEMIRDQRTIFPVSTLGKADWYVRTESLPTSTTTTVSATMISKAGATGRWQFTLPKTVSPGFYEVTSVKLPNTPYSTGSMNIIRDTVAGDVSGSDWYPDLVGNDFAYTPYQTRTILFEDAVTNAVPLAVGATASYEVVTYGMAKLDAVQAMAQSRDELPPGVDISVRAPIPCRLYVEVAVEKPVAGASPDADAMRLSMAAAANSVGFNGLVTSTALADAAYNSLTGGAVISKISMLAELRYPDGSRKVMTDDLVIRIPYEPEKGVTSKTANFFLHPEDIRISIGNFV